MFEIGVQNGGWTQMWKHYFGPYAKIVGIDLEPKCKSLEEPGICVHIGDQSNTDFLSSLVAEFGPPDIVLDDGSHQVKHINATFDLLFPLMRKGSVYMVEDLHTAYWPEYGGGLNNPLTFINRSKNFVDALNAHHTRGALPQDDFCNTVTSIHFYDSIVCIEKNNTPRGSDMIGPVAPVWEPRLK